MCKHITQRCLGASEDRELGLVPMRKDSMQTFSGSPSTKLPEEILHEIFTFAISHEERKLEYYKSALALSRTCKRFHRIVKPLLFKNIELGYPMRLFRRALRRFNEAIENNRALGTLCKSLSFHMPSIYRLPFFNDNLLTGKLFNSLPNVTSLQIHGGFGSGPTWPFMKESFQNMSHIKSLRFSRECWDLFLAPICDIIQTMQLQVLTLDGISPLENCFIPAPTSRELERTLTITKLNISDFGETPEALKDLLKLPKALEHFRFGKIHSNPVQWNINQFPRLLHDHRASLKSIEIGAVGLREAPGISFLDFPQLETLKLSRWVFDCSPGVASSTLLGPKLQSFIWDFTVEDQHSESWTNFGQEQKGWILKFAELSIAQKSALRRIKIIFNPDEIDGSTTREALVDFVSPWDLMDEVRDIIRPNGIELSYNQCWTREECLKRIEAAEKDAMKDLECLNNTQSG